jgi:hypothetical protein
VIPLALGAAVSPVVFFGSIAAMTGPFVRKTAYAFGTTLPLLALTAVPLILGRALSLPEASNSVKGGSTSLRPPAGRPRRTRPAAPAATGPAQVAFSGGSR